MSPRRYTSYDSCNKSNLLSIESWVTVASKLYYFENAKSKFQTIEQ